MLASKHECDCIDRVRTRRFTLTTKLLNMGGGHDADDGEGDEDDSSRMHGLE